MTKRNDVRLLSLSEHFSPCHVMLLPFSSFSEHVHDPLTNSTPLANRNEKAESRAQREQTKGGHQRVRRGGRGCQPHRKCPFHSCFHVTEFGELGLHCWSSSLHPRTNALSALADSFSSPFSRADSLFSVSFLFLVPAEAECEKFHSPLSASTCTRPCLVVTHDSVLL